jgi:hypothetical protein
MWNVADSMESKLTQNNLITCIWNPTCQILTLNKTKENLPKYSKTNQKQRQCYSLNHYLDNSNTRKNWFQEKQNEILCTHTKEWKLTLYTMKKECHNIILNKNYYSALYQCLYLSKNVREYKDASTYIIHFINNK